MRIVAGMQGLLLRLSTLDADAENAVRVIGFFDRLIAGRAGLDALVRSTAQLAECPVGISAPATGLSIRAEPESGLVASADIPKGAARRELEGGTVVWVARSGPPPPLDEMLLERFAIAVAVLLDHSSVPLPELGDPALVELVVSATAGTAERSRALHLLGLEPLAPLRVLATPGDLEGRSAVVGDVRAVLLVGSVPALAVDRVGVGPLRPAIEAAQSWQAARTALRFTSKVEPVIWWEHLGGLAPSAERLDPSSLAAVPDVCALDQLAAEDIAVLDAFCATGSARRAADVLHRHHSTVPARLTRAEGVLGFPLTTPAGRFRLQLALTLRRLRDDPT